MRVASSRDGTRIAFETQGQGPPLLLVDGAFCHRGFGPMPSLAPLLAPRFTVVTYDRRGRGASGDTPPHRIEREVEDIEAVVDAVGGEARVFGISSGALLAVHAAASGVRVPRLALYEPPLVLRDAPGTLPPDLKDEVVRHAQEGRRGDAVRTFMRMVGVPPLVIPLMRIMPGVWSKLTAVAHTLPYDLALLEGTGAEKPLPPRLQDAMAAVRAPTLVAVGGKSPPYMRHAVETVAERIPGSELRVLDKQTHNVAAKALAPALLDFLGRP